MDMVRNQSLFGNLNYVGEFGWGKLDARLTWQDTEHEMGFFTQEKSGTMPMNTHGRDLGYVIKAEIPLADAHLLRAGHERQRQRLDDWWPPVPGSMMMGPNAFVNINDGKRDRYAIWGEVESRWTPQWTTLAGLREEFVRMDTGTVQPYSSMPGMMGMMNPDPAAAAAFNARDRSRRDNNFDFSLLARFQQPVQQAVRTAARRHLPRGLQGCRRRTTGVVARCRALVRSGRQCEVLIVARRVPVFLRTVGDHHVFGGTRAFA